MEDHLHHSNELDELKSVWVRKRRDNELLIGGNINFFTIAQLRKSTEQWLERLRKSYNVVIVNMEQSKPSGTVCVSYMLCLVRLADKLQLQVTFVNVPDELRGILELSGMTDILALDRTTR